MPPVARFFAEFKNQNLSSKNDIFDKNMKFLKFWNFANFSIRKLFDFSQNVLNENDSRYLFNQSKMKSNAIKR